jgi:hypothetical protein
LFGRYQLMANEKERKKERKERKRNKEIPNGKL